MNHVPTTNLTSIEGFKVVELCFICASLIQASNVQPILIRQVDFTLPQGYHEGLLSTGPSWDRNARECVEKFPFSRFCNSGRAKRQCSSKNTKEKQEINTSTHRYLPKRTKNSQILQISARAAPPLLGLHRLCLKLQRAATHHIDLSGLLNQNSKTWLEHPSDILHL